MDIYGLVFRDFKDSSLNVAIFNEDKTQFTEVYEIDEDFNNSYKDLTQFQTSFVKINMSNPTVASFKSLLYINFEKTSREIIVDCYSVKYPKLINNIFNKCINYNVLDS